MRCSVSISPLQTGSTRSATLKARIAGFKVPKQILLAAELPRNAMGTVQKNPLRQQHAGLFV